MPSRNELNLRARAVGFDPATAGFANDSKLEQKVLWLEKNASAVTGTAATGTLTSDNTNVSDGDTVTIGGQTYTFKTALTASTTANQVLIGADADASLTNLVSAINSTGTAGTDYGSMTPINQYVSAAAVGSHATVVTAKNFALGDTATTETSSHLSWGAATLGSGAAKVVAAAGAGTKDSVAGISGDRNTSV